MSSRLKPDLRKQQILDTAVTMARQMPWHRITRESVSSRLGVAPSLITYHYGDIAKLKNAVITEGCKQRVNKIILIGLAQRHPDALSLPASVKQAATK